MNVLFGALLVIVVGSLTGEWLSIMNQPDRCQRRFYLGHQGYEYVDLGRAWQILLFAGLLIWLILVVRAHSAGAEERRRPAPTALAVRALRAAPSACSTAPG